MSAAERIQRKRIDDHGLIWCPGPNCRDYIPAERFSFRTFRGKYQPLPYCKRCDAARSRLKRAKRVQDAPKASPLRLTAKSAPPPVVETPKPAPVVLAPRPAKPIVYPKAKAADCIHAASVCWADDGRALAAHIHQQGIAPGIVRGFFATVSDDEHEYCRPRFERPGLAALFDELMKAKYGVRDQREAA